MSERSTASHDPDRPAALLEYVTRDWAPRVPAIPAPHPSVESRLRRRAAVAARFPGEWLVLPSGQPKVRANDTFYRFRPSTEFAWLVGSTVPGSVLVVDPAGAWVLYQQPSADRSTTEFFTDRVSGELWIGPRPDLAATGALHGIETRPLEELAKALEGIGAVRLLRGHDAVVDAMVGALVGGETDADGDRALVAGLDELRLVKDEYEIEQLQQAVNATLRGFADVVRALPDAQRATERWAEGVFGLRARVEGNDVGYNSICAAGTHACILHWTDNDGPVRDGDLILLDMGVEGNELYTADVTRTLPVNGRFTDTQREVYTLVYQAQEAALAAVRPGADFFAPHRAAMRVLAHGLERLGVLPDAEAALAEDQQLYRRYTLHGTSHMLGIDVHDCAAARNELYRHGPLRPGYVLTIEPGLYFQPDDLTVPVELRGIGVRIEDDVVVTEDGCRNLSAALPREPAEVEAWMAAVVGSAGPDRRED